MRTTTLALASAALVGLGLTASPATGAPPRPAPRRASSSSAPARPAACRPPSTSTRTTSTPTTSRSSHNPRRAVLASCPSWSGCWSGRGWCCMKYWFSVSVEDQRSGRRAAAATDHRRAAHKTGGTASPVHEELDDAGPRHRRPTAGTGGSTDTTCAAVRAASRVRAHLRAGVLLPQARALYPGSLAPMLTGSVDLGERLGRRAGADQVAVAVRLVDRGPPAASTCRGRSGREDRPARASRRGPSPRPGAARCAARGAAGSPSALHSPDATASISRRIAIIASQNRSISARSSDSVGSTIRVPATGNDIVGAWKP